VKRALVLLLLFAGAASLTTADSSAVVGTLTVTLSESSPSAVVSGTKLYYASSSGTLTVKVEDSGPLTITSVNFPSVFGDDPDPSAETSYAYAWTSSATDSGTKSVAVTYSDLSTGSVSFTVTPDTAAPTGQTVALDGGPWFTSASVPLTIGAGTDAGAGVDSTGGVVERAAATLTNGSCGTFGAFSAVTPSGGADTSVTSGNCYRYQYKAKDNVGNVSTASPASSDAKVDTSAPTTPTLFFSGLSNTAAVGSTVFYGAKSGSFTLTTVSGDPESGIASYAFPAIAGFTPVGAGAARTYTFTGETTAPSGPQSLTATNAAGLTSAPASFTLVADQTAPTVVVLCNGKPCVDSPYAKAVTVTVTASDGTGSGVGAIRYTVDGTDPTGGEGTEYTDALTVRSLTHLKVRAYDKTGNASTPVSVTINSFVDKLVVTAPARVTVKAGARYLVVRMSATRRSLATASMSRPGVKRAARWHFLLPGGTSIVRLRLPAGLKRPAAYKVVWTLVSDSQKSTKTTFVSVR
jgi:Chitobiase/beta-hexosaminidase C-terminal domain